MGYPFFSFFQLWLQNQTQSKGLSLCFFYFSLLYFPYIQSECIYLTGVNMKKLSRIFRIYSEAPLALFMAIGCIIELVCALGLYSYNADVLALCALISSGFFGFAAFAFASSVYRDVKRNTWILG